MAGNFDCSYLGCYLKYNHSHFVHSEEEYIKTPVKPGDDTLTVGITFPGGSMRSEQKLPFWKLGRRAMIEWAKRFAKGEKYDLEKGMSHNWKVSLNSGDLEFIRQFYNHAEEHILNAKELAEHKDPENHRDSEGENMFDHLGAAMWNIAALIEYLAADPENTCKALSQKPE